VSSGKPVLYAGKSEAAQVAETNHAESSRSEAPRAAEPAQSVIFAVSKKQLKLVERLFGQGKDEAASQARWDEAVKVSSQLYCDRF